MDWIKWIVMISTFMPFTVSQGWEVESICPVFVDKENVTIECRINSSQIVQPRCFLNPTTVSYIFTTPLGIPSNTLCATSFPSTTCNITNSGCGCTSNSGFMYIYNYTFTADRTLHNNVSFTCSVDCFGASPQLSQNHNSCAFINVATPPTTVPSTTASTVPNTTISSSEAPTTGSTTLLTSASISLNNTSVSSSNVNSIAHTFDTTDHSPSDTTVNSISNTNVHSTSGFIDHSPHTLDYTATIVGASFAGLVILALIIVIMCLICYKRVHNKNQSCIQEPEPNLNKLNRDDIQASEGDIDNGIQSSSQISEFNMTAVGKNGTKVSSEPNFM